MKLMKEGVTLPYLTSSQQ